MRIAEKLNSLKDTDIYSLLLFVLFKVIDIPQYSTLSELVYILDKNNLLKLCEYFGGTTIKIPTIQDLQILVQSLVLYQKVNIQKNDFDKSLKLLGQIKNQDIKKIKKSYVKLCQVLQNYELSKK